MSGKAITEQQAKLYMEHRKAQPQTVAAAKAGISERSARRIDHDQRNRRPRGWRTRKDPLEPIWESIVLPLIQGNTDITPVGLFDHLCEYHSDLFDPKTRRTLERRIQHWRQLHGPGKEVMFTQTHALAALGIADFTWITDPVFIAGEPIRHRLFHYRLVASGWAYAQVVYGGESFSALADGLQKAFRASGGIPYELRTDSLSAAYKNRTEQDDFTERFEALCQHYGLKPTRNNRGVAHENGAIESPNNHIKQQLKQALLMRGNANFTSRKAYQAFVQSVVDRRNRRITSAWQDEQRQLQPLPVYDSVNYTQHCVRVSRTSSISLKRVVYSVPSRLVGSQLMVHLFDDRLELWCGGVHTLNLDRIHARKQERLRSVNYRHIIESLVKKPRAFRHSQWREDLLPSEDYRTIWAHVDQHLGADDASHYMVRLLHLAKKGDCEAALGRYVIASLERQNLPTLKRCEDRFLDAYDVIPQVVVRQHALSDYQALLSGRRPS